MKGRIQKELRFARMGREVEALKSQKQTLRLFSKVRPGKNGDREVFFSRVEWWGGGIEPPSESDQRRNT